MKKGNVDVKLLDSQRGLQPLSYIVVYIKKPMHLPAYGIFLNLPHWTQAKVFIEQQNIKPKRNQHW